MGKVKNYTAIAFTVMMSLSLSFWVPVVSGQTEQRARIAVFRPTNLEGGTNYDGLCTTIAETIALNLKLIGDYSVEETGRSAPDSTEELQAFLEAEHIDNAVYGDLFLDEDENIVIELSVYDRGKREIRTTERVVAESFLDIFSTTDRLVTALLGTFSDRHIAYGSLNLVNRGVEGEYTVSLNGAVVGRSITNIPRLLTGTYELAVSQERPFETEELAGRKVEIRRGKTAEVEFFVPYLTDRESKTFTEFDTKIMRWWAADPSQMKELFETSLEASDLGETVSPGIAEQHDKYLTLQEVYGRREMLLPVEDLGEPSGELSKFYRDHTIQPDLYKKRVGGMQTEFFSSRVLARPYEVLEEEVSRQKPVLRPEAQIAGGTLAVAGFNYAFWNRRVQVSLMAGAGLASDARMASAVRFTWSIFKWKFTPTLSLYSTQLNNFEKIAVAAGPSLGFTLKLDGFISEIYLENNLTLNIVPRELYFDGPPPTLYYLPSLGVKF